MQPTLFDAHAVPDASTRLIVAGDCKPQSLAVEQLIGPSASGAAFAADLVYRYTLWRRWRPQAPLHELAVFIGLNPSTADERADDPTIRRCINFARDWGCGGMVMLNLFAYRATDPAVMKSAAEPVGPANDATIATICRGTGRIVTAWGVHGEFQGRGVQVLSSLLQDPDSTRRVLHLGRTKAGHPKHPLYLRGTTKPATWAEVAP